MTRRAGTYGTADGSMVVWTVADGRRGRRWREVRSRDGAVDRALLLETDPDGRVTRLEISAAAGLLTLHPEADDSALYGNVATPGGIRHHAFAWSADHALVVDGSAASMAALIRRHPTGPIRAVLIGDDLVPREETLDPASVDVSLDADGVAVSNGPSWPLETDS